MTNGNGRKAQIRQYAEDNGVTYTAALREVERLDALFDLFKAQWVKFSDNPVRLDGLDVLVSVTPDLQEPFDVDWDELERTGEFRKVAFDMALDYLPSFMGQAGIDRHDWTANAAPAAEADDDSEALMYRVTHRVEVAYQRLFGTEASLAEQAGTDTWVWVDDEMVVLAGLDWGDIERRGAYDELATKIHGLIEDRVALTELDDDDDDDDDDEERAPIDVERQNALFALFKAQWVKFSDNPIQLDGLDLLVSVTPGRQERIAADFREFEGTEGLRSFALEISRAFTASGIDNVGSDEHDWTPNATAPSPDDVDEEARERRVANRVQIAFRRLHSMGINFHSEPGHTFVVFPGGHGMQMPPVDWADVELRGAYEELAEQVWNVYISALEDGIDDDDDDDDDEPEWTAIDYSDPEWAFKVTPEQFYAEQRYRHAAGQLSAAKVALLEKSEPGWYDKWLNADPLSTTGYKRRNAICDGVVPDTIRVYNHPEDAVMEFENLATGTRIPVELTGTDEEMRQAARDAVAKLLG